MNEYIATFYTHLAALISQRKLQSAGFAARMMPVPRSLSSSCGTCVRYTAPDCALALLHPDHEQVVQVVGEAFVVLVENK